MGALKEKVLGKTGLKVRTLGFGGIPIQRVSEDEAVDIVRHCYDLGMNYFDTARGYTISEERIGKALEDVRGNVIIATKSGRRTAEEVEKELETSLKNLRTDYIDNYQLHNVSNQQQWEQVRAPDGAMDAINKAHEEGVIKHISITSHNPDIAVEMVKSGLFETLMIPYNYLTPKPADVLLPLCKKLNVGTIIMKPFGGGAFSNANTALKWVFNDPNTDLVIPGVMSIDEVDENFAIWQGDLTITPEEEELIAYDKKELGDSFCRGCDYCQPCPSGIPISYVLRAEKQMLRRMGWSDRRVEGMKEAFKKVERCIECGACESRCPYELTIIKLLPEAVASLKIHMENRTIP
jgi:predicted aldo/keto reductase-like oxidoreductase